MLGEAKLYILYGKKGQRLQGFFSAGIQIHFHASYKSFSLSHLPSYILNEIVPFGDKQTLKLEKNLEWD